MIIYNKAVRDKIPLIIEKNGKNHQTVKLDNIKYLQALKLKLQEELDEFLQDEDVSELADMMEVIYAVANIKGVTDERLEEIRTQKRDKNGAFKENLYLISVED